LRFVRLFFGATFWTIGLPNLFCPNPLFMQDQAGTIGQVIQAWAVQQPDAVALRAPQCTDMTYHRLAQQVAQTATELQRLGLRSQSRLALCVENSPAAIAAFLSVSATAISAPLNPSYSQSEFERYFRSLQIDVVVVAAAAGSNSAAIVAAQALGLKIFELVVDQNTIAGQFRLQQYGDSELTPNADVAAVLNDRPNAPQSLALLLQTSGTTATPKVVPLTHHNLIAAAGNFVKAYDLTPADRCLMIVPLFHSQGLIGAVLAPILSGGMIIATSGFDADEFWQWLEIYQPTWYTAVPTMNQAIMAAVPPSPPNQTSLRFIRSAAAGISDQLLTAIETTLKAPVINGYGMTEAYQLTANPLPPGRRKVGSVGLPIRAAVKVVNEQGVIIPHGEVGEIWVKGENVIAAYEGVSDEINTATFQQGWLRTGDLGYFDRDGYLFLTTRVKELIKQGGEKITPQEIDAVLLAHPAVCEAIAFAVPHSSLGEAVAAAVVCAESQAVTAAELREFAALHLASFKVPSQIVFLDRLPTGATGKLQRVGLAETLATHLQSAFIAPRDAIETALAEIWQQVLNISTIGIHDNFFALGGDSLSAVKLLSRIEAEFNRPLPADMLFRHLTIAELARAIASESTDDAATGPTVVPIRTAGTELPIFAVHDITGKVACYRHLAKYLDTDRPFYGLQCPHGEDDLSHLNLTIEALARSYIMAMKTLQPQGPYHLLGYSLGGLIALEMAQQLQHQGEVVQFIGLLDTFIRRDFATLSRRERLIRHMNHLQQQGPNYLLRRVIRRLMPQPIESPVDDLAIPPTTTPEPPNFMPLDWVTSSLFDDFQRAIDNYQMTYYSGNVSYFCAWDDSENFREWYKYDAYKVWSRRVKTLYFSYAAGNHGTFLQDSHAQLLAPQIDVAIAQANVQERSAQPTSPTRQNRKVSLNRVKSVK
jgi:oxalate---CoA ligase